MLIPWYIAPMAKGKDGKRTFRIYLDRVIGSTGERSAWPAASFERPRFLSDFTPIEVPVYNQALIAITPYVSGLYDNGRQRTSNFDAGADIFWKPNGQFQLTATHQSRTSARSRATTSSSTSAPTKPSSATSARSSPRTRARSNSPRRPTSASCVYTRRVGGPTDDGSGAGDITAAVKANGSFGATKYGVLIADEADAVGRTFTRAAPDRTTSPRRTSA